MRRYAFIDVLNTGNTAEKSLGFAVDWDKLAEYLINKKSCTEIYFYTGIENGDTATAEEFEALSKRACCIVRSKSVFVYKNPPKTYAVVCRNCTEENAVTLNTGYTRKSNCDVELGVDAIERAGSEVELMIFTADGDFEYLIRRAIEKGVSKVYVYSYAGKKRPVGAKPRFSTKLRELIAEKPDKVVYVSLEDIKNNIKKSLPTA